MAKAKGSAKKEDPFDLLYALVAAVLKAKGAEMSSRMVKDLDRVGSAMRESAPEAKDLLAELLRPILISPVRGVKSDESDRLTEVVEKLHLKRDVADLVKLRIMTRPLLHMRRAKEDKLMLGVRILESMAELRRLKVKHDIYFDAAANMAMHLIAGEFCHC